MVHNVIYPYTIKVVLQIFTRRFRLFYNQLYLQGNRYLLEGGVELTLLGQYEVTIKKGSRKQCVYLH